MPKISADGATGGGGLPVPDNAFIREDGVITAPPGGGGGGSVDSVTAGDDSIVVGGSASAPAVETGTLDVIATLHPPAASVPMNDHKLTGLASGSASGDSVAYGQLGSAAFEESSAFAAAPAGEPAAGGSVLYDGSGPRWYAAAWRFVVGPDTAGSAYPATPDGGTTDNAAVIQSAINDALAYAAANSGKGIVYLEPLGVYGVNNDLVQGGSTLGNGQLTLAPCSPLNSKVIVYLTSDKIASPQYHWLQTASPQVSGAAILSNGLFGSSGAQADSISTYGNPCVIGGPNQLSGGTAGTRYGTTDLNFSNMCAVLENLAILVPRSDSALTYCPFDFSGLAQAEIRGCQFAQATTYANTWSDGGNISDLSGGLCWAGLMPANGNNDISVIEDVTVAGGFTYGILLTEHTEIRRLSQLYCWTPVCICGDYFDSAGAGHVIGGGAQISVEGYDHLIKVFGSGADGITQVDLCIDTEGTPDMIDDSDGDGIASLCGRLKLGGLFPLADVAFPPTGIKVESLRTPSGWTFGYTGFSDEGTTVAVQNLLWRDARVYWSGGTVSEVKAGPVGGTSAPSMTTVSTAAAGDIGWPAGAWLSFTYTGSPTWDLEVS